jgi:phosphoenolpyruvate carboxylase
LGYEILTEDQCDTKITELRQEAEVWEFFQELIQKGDMVLYDSELKLFKLYELGNPTMVI